MSQKDDGDSNEGKRSRPFDAYDVQKIRLEKLFANIDKPVEIPDFKEEKKFAQAPEFVRNVMGSSAGAGSGEFHVYRQLRRKEYARLHFIETQARNEELDAEYHRKIEENRKRAAESTEKKRAKRLKKKEKLKQKRLQQNAKKGDDGGDDNEPNSTNEQSN